MIALANTAAFILTAYRHHSTTAGKNYAFSFALCHSHSLLCWLQRFTIGSTRQLREGCGRVHLLPIPASEARHDAT